METAGAVCPEPPVTPGQMVRGLAGIPDLQDSPEPRELRGFRASHPLAVRVAIQGHPRAVGAVIRVRVGLVDPRGYRRSQGLLGHRG